MADTRTYEFAMVVSGFDIDLDANLDRLHEVFDDVSATRQAGRTLIQLVVEADGEWDALNTARRTIEDEFPGTHVVGLDRDLVTIPDVADRFGCSPESVRLLSSGKRGPGNFPPPVGLVGGGTKVWEWAAVAAWARATGRHVEDNKLIGAKCAAYFDASLFGPVRPKFVPSKAEVQQPTVVRRSEY